MKITREQLEQLMALARADAPRETCGIIGGENDQALQIYPLKNLASEPNVRYDAEPQGLLNALRDIEAQGWEHIGIYHSHPASPAYPSETDIARAFYPEVTYVIISLANPEQATMRAYRIVDRKVSEVTLEVEDIKDESSRTYSGRTSRRASRPRSGRTVAALSKRRPARGNVRRAGR